MVVRSTRDTLTTCDPEIYDNIFQVNKRSDFKAVSVQSSPKDTMERSLSKEALDRLQQPSKDTIAQPSFLFRRIGKYVFLTVALPPYFLLYGLPKWLLVEALPTLLSLFALLTGKIQQKIQKPFNKVVHVFNQLLFFLQMGGKRLLLPVAKLGIEIRQFFQRLNQNIQNYFGRLAEKTKTTFKKPGIFFSNLAKRIKNGWTGSRKWIGEKALLAHEGIQKGLEWIKDSPHLLLGWGAAQLQKINNSQANWIKKISTKFEGSTKAAHACSSWVGRQLGALKRICLLGFTPITKMYQHLLKPVFSFVGQRLKKGMHKMGNFLNDRKKRALEFIQELQVRVKTWTPQDALERFLSNSFLSRLPALLRKFLIMLKQNLGFQFVFKLGFQLVKMVILQSSRLAQFLIVGLSLASEKISDVYSHVSQTFKNMTASTVNLISHSLMISTELGKKGFNGALILLIMGGYLTLWGFEGLADITARCLSRISLNNKLNVKT